MRGESEEEMVMYEHENLSQEEREFLRRADTDGRVHTSRGDRRIIQELERKGLIEQNVYHGAFYWVKEKIPR